MIRDLQTVATCVSPETAPPFSPAHDDIRVQLGKILTSRFFSNSERISRFLIFAADHALSGNSTRLKEYLVGVQVFDRKAEYDPRIDPIVRVEARRLRAKLKSYYTSIGRGDQLLITIPKGTYTPVFRFRTSAQPWRLRSAGVPRPPLAISVLPFADLTKEVEDEHFSEGLTEELIHRIAQLDNLRLVAWPSLGHLERTDAVLRGSIRRESESVRVIAQLIDTRSGTYLWSETYNRDAESLLSVQDRIAQAIVARLEVTLFPDVYGTRSRLLSSTAQHSQMKQKLL